MHVTDRSPLTQEEFESARDIAAQMKENPRKQFMYMLSRVGTDPDTPTVTGGCWNRGVRQAIYNFHQMPSRYT